MEQIYLQAQNIFAYIMYICKPCCSCAYFQILDASKVSAES